MSSRNKNLPTHLVVALSGGIDSVVLLHYLHTFVEYTSLRAVHINHHISPYANEWQEFCEHYAQTLNIPLAICDITLSEHKNLEANARQLRYQALYNQLSDVETLVTAHHQNDQAETVLLNACRGSSVLGLSGMLECSTKLWRPFLHKNRAWIINYANQHQLNHIADESNLNTYFRRNFIRHTIIPSLEEKYPSAVKSLAKVATYQQTARILLDDLAQLDITTYKIIHAKKLQIHPLKQLSKERALNVIYYYLGMYDIMLPQSAIAQELYASLFARQDARVHICWSNYHWRIFKQQVYIESTTDKPHQCDLYEALKNIPDFNIQYRTRGQRIRFAHKTHSEKLNEVMRTHAIPPWKRDQVRLYYIANNLVAIEYIGVIDKGYYKRLVRTSTHNA